jgi:hypothetical protein
MIYATNAALVEDIHGLKLMRNGAEVWRWVKGKSAWAEGEAEINMPSFILLPARSSH